MRLRRARIERHRLVGGRPGFRLGRRGGDEPLVVPRPEVCVGETRVGRSERRIQRDRLLELLDGLVQILVARAVEEVAALQVGVVGPGIHAGGRREARLLAFGETHVDLARDGGGEVALQREHIVRAALEAPGPEVAVGAGIDELGGDPDPIPGTDYRAFDDGVDVQRLRDLRRGRPVRAPELHGRAARDHPELADGGEGGGQLVRHPLREVVLGGVPGVVVQGEHGDRPDGDGGPGGGRGTRRRGRLARKCQAGDGRQCDDDDGGEGREGCPPAVPVAAAHRYPRSREGRIGGFGSVVSGVRSRRRPGQRLHEVERAGETIGGLLGQRAQDRRLGCRRHAFPHYVERRGGLGHEPGQHRPRRRPRHRRLACDHLVGDRGQRVDVAAGVQLPRARRLLEAHVRGRADGQAGSRDAVAGRVGQGDGDAEVGEQRLALLEEDVRRLDVTVEHGTAVGEVEGARHLADDPERLLDGKHLLPREAVPQRLPLNQRHHVEQRAVGFAGVVEGEDVRVLEARGDLDLAEEAPGLQRRGEIRLQHLERDWTADTFRGRGSPRRDRAQRTGPLHPRADLLGGGHHARLGSRRKADLLHEQRPAHGGRARGGERPINDHLPPCRPRPGVRSGGVKGGRIALSMRSDVVERARAEDDASAAARQPGSARDCPGVPGGRPASIGTAADTRLFRSLPEGIGR